ncbi:DUF4270 domain-containing protein [Aestuariibaculum suncheonense]|uniref:DUF4270 domain-containing protein n=1 Tax=Aestuariibaculum suncheonense TaxID=1028745 RepID=A0A8J6Q3X1_9FLAO|nr:DUF4270 domain-containing protein [Aestuariibaculum suncheonense]MBD0833974.1 DUF4270 domain-containing protein [Aestuariibaculum suncheonense]
MKKTISALKFAVCTVVISSFLACDKDFASVDSDVLGEDNTNFQTNKESLPILAYNKKLNSLQIDGLTSNLLGVFNDPAFGQTTASIITQVTPSTYSPNFGDNTVIDSVVITIPYYSRVTGLDDEGLNEYTISDSLYGNAEAPIKLTVFKNEYFLRDFDPSAPLGQAQYYYSKADGEINVTDNFALNGSSTINFDDHKYTTDTILKIEEFTPSAKRINLETKDEDGEITSTTNIAPAFRVKLDNTNFWESNIINQEDNDVLTSASAFQNYFRGLYFKAEAIGTDGQMLMLNLGSSDANITIYYSYSTTTGTGDNATTTTSNSTYTLSFSGKRLNTFINNYNLVTLPEGNSTEGDSKLYLKGTEGSMAIVDLFAGTSDYEGETMSTLDAFKHKHRIPLGKVNGEYTYKKDERGNYLLKRLINDAQLIIYEDEAMNTGGDEDFHKYDRIYAYDIANNIPLIDYSLDPISNTADPYNSVIVHLGQRRENDENGQAKYKIRITEHLNNILLRDSTNTKVGLVLSTNVNSTSNARILNSDNDEVTNVPAASIITPRGTILHGTNDNVSEDVKMKLEVFFTEPK